MAKLEVLYKKTIESHAQKSIDKELLRYIVETVHLTRRFTFSRSEQSGVLALIHAAKHDLPVILRTTFPRVFSSSHSISLQ